MELCGFLISCVLRIGVYSFFFESLFDDFALDEFFCSPIIMHRAYYFRVGWDDIFLEIGMFWSLLILYPGRSVFLIGGVVECAFGCSGEGVLSGLSHLRFIYNLNNILSKVLELGLGVNNLGWKKAAVTKQSWQIFILE